MTHGSRPRPGQQRPGRSRPRRPRRGRVRALRGTSLVRLRIGFLLIAMIVSVFAARLFQLQGVDAAAYVAKARAEGVVTVSLPANRGTIKDRNGVALAESVDGLMIVADPTLTAKHASAIASVIARRLDIDYFDVLGRLRKPGTHFQYVARRVPSTEAKAVVKEIDDRGFKGIDTRRDPVRTYPAHDVAANILGFMNAEGQAGEGAELMFDHLLAGRDGTETYEIGGGNRIPLGDNSTVPARSGHDLRLTIDRDVQWYAQRALGNAVQSSGSDSGAAVVMDTRTGELLALADYPTFNPSNTAGTSKKLLGSRALRAMYEPGSVEKILTTAALLNDHLVSPRTRIVVPPQLQVADRVIHDDVAHGRMKLTLTGVIARSSNIGVTLAADQISAKRLHDYLSRFGLGRRTGLGVRGETPGLLADPSTWGAAQKANIAFGQGVAVNAVQMAAAVNTIANGGVYVPPSLVKGRASLNDGTVVGSATGTSRRVVSAATARAETSMMETVTKDGGTAPGTAIAGYNVAGKTGTAQRVDQRCHCYSSARVVSFAGFAPADAPRFLVYVVADRPRNGGFGSTVAGPVFRELMTYLLQKYAVPPTGHVAKTPPLTW